MRIEWVKAVAFGPLSDAVLTLGPGLTIITGPNESAKSTWHGAIYAAICGRRRGKGATRAADRAFAQRYRPWGRSEWQVVGRLVLDDGRTIEVTHDLDGNVDCRAMDVDLGRDVSGEIMHDGSPDASRWLGMNRDIFAATACVRQAEILAVLKDAGGLQHHLEAAATQAGNSDANAAEALAALEAYHRAHVGADRVTSRKPLRTALVHLEDARRNVHEVRRDHAAYTELVVHAEALERDAALLHREVTLVARRLDVVDDLLGEATALDRTCRDLEVLSLAANESRADRDEIRQRYARAVALHREVGDHTPDSAAADHEVISTVTQALAQWQTRPSVPALDGPDPDTLRKALDGVPVYPRGDLEVHGSVASAWQRFTAAQVMLDTTTKARPTMDPVSADDTAAMRVGATSLRTWASRLEAIGDIDELRAVRSSSGQPPPAPSPSAQSRSYGGGRAAALAAAAVGAMMIGIALIVMGLVAAGAGVFAAALLLATAALLTRRHPSGLTQGHALEPALQPDKAQSLRREDASASTMAAHREAIEQGCTEAGVPTDPAALHRLAARVETLIAQRQQLAGWHQDLRTREQEVRQAQHALCEALSRRDVPCGPGEATEAYETYTQACARRFEQAHRSAERPVLLSQLQARADAEAARTRALDAQAEALGGLRAAANVAGLVDIEHSDGQELVAALRGWLQTTASHAREVDVLRRASSDLASTLNGMTLTQLRERLDTADEDLRIRTQKKADAVEDIERSWVGLHARAEQIGLRLSEIDSCSATLRHEQSHLRTQLQRLQTRSRTADDAASEARGKRLERHRTLRSVAEAEETLAVSQRELERVQTLQHTLDLTTQYLTRAQEQVHRSIAPTLQLTLNRWLPVVTAGRYTEAAVDPESLAVSVKVSSGRWVPATGLSLGTAEQIYLLLRVALVTHLSEPGTSCPLILDDVTVQADEGRTHDLLGALAEIAADRQVVLFAQQRLVERWAQGRDDVTVIRLTPVPP